MRTEDRETSRFSDLPLEPRFLIVIAGTILFALLTVLVGARRLAGVDYDVSVAKQGTVNPLLDGWAAAVSILASGELSALYGAIGATRQCLAPGMERRVPWLLRSQRRGRWREPAPTVACSSSGSTPSTPPT